MINKYSLFFATYLDNYFYLLGVASFIYFCFKLFEKRFIFNQKRSYIFVALFVFALFMVPVPERGYTSWGLPGYAIIALTVIALGAALAILILDLIATVELLSEEKEEQQPEPEPEALPPPVVHEIPEIRRYEHTLVLGSSGAGKTTLLSDLIMQDVSKGNTTVVFDSKGSLVDALLHIRIPRERVILIDPTDERPIALGLFDFNTDGATHREREANLNRVIELLSFTLGALDADATSKQELPLRFLIRLCLQIPGATLLTLRDLLTEGLKGYEQYVQELPETARLFFQQQFFTKDLASTREQLSRRVYTILENPTMERMFSSPKTRFSMKRALDDGQFILVNTAKAQLGEERSAFFSRFIFALMLQAVQQRDLSKDNTPTFIYIDEAAPVIDKNIATALETLREYKTGITLAFQNLGQIPHEFQQSIITNTSTKFLAGLSAKDARALAEDVGTHHESLLMQPRLTFHVSVRNLFRDTTVVTPGLLKKLPQRDDLKQLLEENREKYCVLDQKKKAEIPDDDLEDLNKA